MSRNGNRILPVICTVFAGLLVTGCDKDLQERVDRLEAELRGVRSDTRDEVGELKDRIIAAETKVGVSEAEESLEERISLLEKSLGDILSDKTQSDEMVYLRPNLQGHAPLNTDHGTFLVRIEGIDLNLDSKGYKVHLNVGNPHALAINQFSLHGDYGGGAPQLPEGEPYTLENEAVRKWQETLTPFEYRVSKTLEPFSWTPFDIILPADSRDELELIRFSMTVESARLNRQDMSMGGPEGESSFGHLRVGAETASVMRTEYGSFFISIKSAEQTEVGTRLHIEVGNPYGFSINQCRLVGDFGPEPPERLEAEPNEEYAQRMHDWSSKLQPFESMISAKLVNFRWNKATILIPGKVDEVKFLRCQLRVEDVSLPRGNG